MANPAFVLEKIGTFKFYDDWPLNADVGPDFVKVRIRTTTICMSDVHYWRYGKIADYKLEKPLVLGHEPAGEVAEVGSNVSDLKVGDRVTIEPGTHCALCIDCSEGFYNVCKDMKFCATPPYDGTLQKYCVFRKDRVFKVPNSMPYEVASLCEPLSVALQAVEESEMKPLSNILIMGSGPIGLASVVAAKALGAIKIVVADRIPFRLNLAKELGATHIISYNDVTFEEGLSSLEKSRRFSQHLKTEADQPEGFASAVETTGNEVCINSAIYSLSSNKALAFVGFSNNESVSIAYDYCINASIRIRGSFRYRNQFDRAVDLLTKNSDYSKIISKEFPFRNAQEAFELIGKGEEDVIKVLIRGVED